MAHNIIAPGAGEVLVFKDSEIPGHPITGKFPGVELYVADSDTTLPVPITGANPLKSEISRITVPASVATVYSTVAASTTTQTIFPANSARLQWSLWNDKVPVAGGAPTGGSIMRINLGAPASETVFTYKVQPDQGWLSTPEESGMLVAVIWETALGSVRAREVL